MTLRTDTRQGYAVAGSHPHEEASCVYSYQLCTFSDGKGNMKLAFIGVFALWKLANTTNQGFFFPKGWFTSTPLVAPLKPMPQHYVKT